MSEEVKPDELEPPPLYLPLARHYAEQKEQQKALIEALRSRGQDAPSEIH